MQPTAIKKNSEDEDIDVEVVDNDRQPNLSASQLIQQVAMNARNAMKKGSSNQAATMTKVVQFFNFEFFWTSKFIKLVNLSALSMLFMFSLILTYLLICSPLPSLLLPRSLFSSSKFQSFLKSLHV